MTLAICLYAATMYSCMRTAMEGSKPVSGSTAFIVSIFWFPIMAIAILLDVAKGVRELLTEKK